MDPVTSLAVTSLAGAEKMAKDEANPAVVKSPEFAATIGPEQNDRLALPEMNAGLEAGGIAPGETGSIEEELRKRFGIPHQESFNSEASQTSVNSLDQVLKDRRGDPETILHGLGFCSNLADVKYRIPDRFLQTPSQAYGISIEKFLDGNPRLKEYLEEKSVIQNPFEMIVTSPQVECVPSKVNSSNSMTFYRAAQVVTLVNRFKKLAEKSGCVPGVHPAVPLAEPVLRMTSNGCQYWSVLSEENRSFVESTGYYDTLWTSLEMIPEVMTEMLRTKDQPEARVVQNTKTPDTNGELIQTNAEFNQCSSELGASSATRFQTASSKIPERFLSNSPEIASLCMAFKENDLNLGENFNDNTLDDYADVRDFSLDSGESVLVRTDTATCDLQPGEIVPVESIACESRDCTSSENLNSSQLQSTVEGDVHSSDASQLQIASAAEEIDSDFNFVQQDLTQNFAISKDSSSREKLAAFQKLSSAVRSKSRRFSKGSFSPKSVDELEDKPLEFVRNLSLDVEETFNDKGLSTLSSNSRLYLLRGNLRKQFSAQSDSSGFADVDQLDMSSGSLNESCRLPKKQMSTAGIDESLFCANCSGRLLPSSASELSDPVKWSYAGQQSVEDDGAFLPKTRHVTSCNSVQTQTDVEDLSASNESVFLSSQRTCEVEGSVVSSSCQGDLPEVPASTVCKDEHNMVQGESVAVGYVSDAAKDSNCDQTTVSPSVDLASKDYQRSKFTRQNDSLRSEDGGLCDLPSTSKSNVMTPTENTSCESSKSTCGQPRITSESVMDDSRSDNGANQNSSSFVVVSSSVLEDEEKLLYSPESDSEFTAVYHHRCPFVDDEDVKDVIAKVSSSSPRCLHSKFQKHRRRRPGCCRTNEMKRKCSSDPEEHFPASTDHLLLLDQLQSSPCISGSNFASITGPRTATCCSVSQASECGQYVKEELKLLRCALQHFKMENKRLRLRMDKITGSEEGLDLDSTEELNNEITDELEKMEEHLMERLRCILTFCQDHLDQSLEEMDGSSIVQSMSKLLQEQVYQSNVVNWLCKEQLSYGDQCLHQPESLYNPESLHQPGSLYNLQSLHQPGSLYKTESLHSTVLSIPSPQLPCPLSLVASSEHLQQLSESIATLERLLQGLQRNTEADRNPETSGNQPPSSVDQKPRRKSYRRFLPTFLKPHLPKK